MRRDLGILREHRRCEDAYLGEAYVGEERAAQN